MTDKAKALGELADRNLEAEQAADTLRMKITYITSRDTPCAFSSAALDKNYCILSLEKIT